MKKILKFIKKNIWYIVVFIFFSLYGLFLPYSHDDWFWGTSWGIEHLNNNFDNINGRYLGNYLVVLLTRSSVAKAIVYGIVLTLIVILINKIVSDKERYTSLIIILLFTLSLNVFIQTVSWTSGFVNYVVPLTGVLYFIYLNKNLINNNGQFSKYACLVMIPLGIFNSLFMENITIYNIIFCIYLIIYFLVKNKKIYLEHILYLIGGIIGTLIMFSNSAYGFIKNGSDTFGERSIDSGNFITSFAHKYLHTFSPELIFNNFILIIILSVLIIVILKKYKKQNFLSKSISVYLIFYSIYALIIHFINFNESTFRYINYINGFLTLIYFALIFVFIICYVSKEKRPMFLAVYFSIVILLLPLFIVNPVQSRCMFPPYVILILLVVLIFNEAEIKNKIINNTIFLIALLLLLHRMYIYGYAYVTDIKRISNIENYNGKEPLVLQELPNKQYFLNSTPANNDYLPKFKEFYHIDQNTVVTFRSNQ